jgi:hypothetical protein
MLRGPVSVERFSLKKLNEVEDKQSKEQYRVEVWNSFTALEDLNAQVDINSAWTRCRVVVDALCY